jgi:GWxTD domain-containing protein
MKQMLRLWMVIFLLLLLRLPTFAIEATVVRTVFFLPDSAKLSRSLPYVEVSWQINPKTLHYMRTAQSTLFARISTELVFYTDTGIVNISRYVVETPERKDLNDILSHSVIQQKRFAITTGKIRWRMKLTDVTDSNNMYVFSDSFVVPPPRDSTFYSGIALIDTLFPAGANAVFEKNGLEQVPLCANFIDDNRKTVRFYTELYGSNLVDTSLQPLVQRLFISRREHEAPYQRYITIDTVVPAQVVPAYGDISVASLHSGNYYLNATIENRLHHIVANTSLYFSLLNTHPVEDTAAATFEYADVSVLDLNKTFIGKYTLAQVRAILRMLLPISDGSQTSAITEFLKNPDDTYMRYFIYNFFAAINKSKPDEAWKQYSEKVRTVNKLFDDGTTPGYQTDRGFIYLRYGEPDNRIKVRNESGSRPYEIWQYNTLHTLTQKNISNAVFLFYQPGEIVSDYVLLHSTAPDEVHNLGWKTYLSINGSGSGSSQADQYLNGR